VEVHSRTRIGDCGDDGSRDDRHKD
jgi:hypothetical protein